MIDFNFLFIFYLQDVISRCDVSDVDPLAVDVGGVEVVTARAQSLKTNRLITKQQTTNHLTVEAT